MRGEPPEGGRVSAARGERLFERLDLFLSFFFSLLLCTPLSFTPSSIYSLSSSINSPSSAGISFCLSLSFPSAPPLSHNQKDSQATVCLLIIKGGASHLPHPLPPSQVPEAEPLKGSVVCLLGPGHPPNQQGSLGGRPQLNKES